jgi:hypothetical protein
MFRKYGCKWKLIAEVLASTKFLWTLREFPNSEHSRHKHKPSARPFAHSIHRRLINPIKTIIAFINQRIKIRARNIGNIIKNQFPDSVFTIRDIYNARAIITPEKLDNYNFTAAFMKLFNKREMLYIVKWVNDNPNHFFGLI